MNSKITYLSLLAMATLAVLSCQKIAKEDLVEEAAPVKTDRFHQALTFHASWANESASTRTAIQADGITVWWTTQESLNVFYGAAYSGEMVSTNQEPASHADFTGYLSPVENASESPNDAFWAVYPYNDSNYCDGQHVFLTVPGGQIASEGTFADKLFPAVARSIDQDLQFYNVCGGACFTVEASGIQAVTFVSRNGAPLAGRVQVTMDSNGRPVIEDVTEGLDQVKVFAPTPEGFVPGTRYYAVLIPQALQQGLDLQFRKDNQVATYQLDKSISVERSMFGLLEEKDAGLTFEDMEQIPLDRLAFEDLAFATYIFDNYDTDHNEELSQEECLAVSSIIIFTDDITSVAGIEYFPNLVDLECYGSQNGLGKLTSLDLSGNPNLEFVGCSNNAIESLDLSAQSQLFGVECTNCNMSVLKLPETSDAFQYLDCSNNLIEELELSGFPNLTQVKCGTNALSSLDVSHNPDLQLLTCASNALHSLNVSANEQLRRLVCNNNSISSLDVSHNPLLYYLVAYSNPLGTIDVSANPLLEHLDIDGIGITTLDVSHNPLLNTLWCPNNHLETLNLANNPALRKLYCYVTDITELDLSMNPKLQVLNCTNCENLTTIYLREGQTIKTVNKPIRASFEYLFTLLPELIQDQTFCDYLFSSFDLDGNNIISATELSLVNTIDVNDSAVASLEGAAYFPNLEAIHADNCQLTSFDGSGIDGLTTLSVCNNQITDMEVSGNPALQELYCSDNLLQALDLSGNKVLKKLWCANNSLEALDVQNNSILEELYCQNNLLTKLVITSNLFLGTLHCEDSPSLADIWAVNGHVFTDLVMDTTTRIHFIKAGDGGAAEGYTPGNNGNWDE